MVGRRKNDESINQPTERTGKTATSKRHFLVHGVEGTKVNGTNTR